MNGYQVMITIGRWQSAKDTVVLKNLSNDTLVTEIKRHMRDNYEGIANCLHMSTQALVWDINSSCHNLIAVYAIREDKLTHIG